MTATAFKGKGGTDVNEEKPGKKEDESTEEVEEDLKEKQEEEEERGRSGRRRTSRVCALEKRAGKDRQTVTASSPASHRSSPKVKYMRR